MTDVDTTLHPSPTGPAFLLAREHSSPALSYPATQPPQYLTLYGSWFCPFVQRVWIVLRELDIPHEYVEINPYKKERGFLALNPRGLVPMLAIREVGSGDGDRNGAVGSGVGDWNGDGDVGISAEKEKVKQKEKQNEKEKEKVLYESTIIADYLDAVYSPIPSTQSSTSTRPSTLYPSYPYTRSRCAIWINHISTNIIPSFYRYLQHTPDKASYTLASAHAEFLGHLRTFVQEMHPSGPYFSGEKLGMVDVALVPWACRVFLLDWYKCDEGGRVVPTGEVEEEEEGERAIWRRYNTWFKAMNNRPSVTQTLSDRERYVDAYKRYAEDTTGSGVGRATRGGRGLP